jgi:hypothetical protein
MAPFILSTDAPAPIPSMESDWASLSLIWRGWDGSVWDLNSRENGVLIYRGGVEGMHNPRITKHASTSRAVPGSRQRGWRAEARDVFWPIYLWGDSSAQWRERNNAFLRTIHPDLPGTWEVTGAETRTLSLTGTFGDPHSYDIDPQLSGWVQYGVTLEAEQPYWAGPKIKRGPWKAPASRSFIDPAGSPPLHISKGSAFGSATIPNPGDVEVWGVWTGIGPLSDIAVGIDDTIVTVPFDLDAGDVLIIDTDPRNPSVTLNGVDAEELLGLQDYAAVAPGDEVDLQVDAAGAGSIEFSLVPLYFRAF